MSDRLMRLVWAEFWLLGMAYYTRRPWFIAVCACVATWLGVQWTMQEVRRARELKGIKQ